MAIESRIVQEAIGWMVKLGSGAATQEMRLQCLQWRKTSPDHERVWQQLEMLNQRIKTVPGNVAHATLDDGALRMRQLKRRAMLKSIALLAGTSVAGLGSYRLAPWQQMLADQSTGTGEQRSLRLADGSSIQLNTGSGIDVNFDNTQRLIRLRHGEILVSTGHPANDPRPFIVETNEGRIRALGTRFLVRQYDGATRIHLYEGATEIEIEGTWQKLRLEAGQQLHFTRIEAGPVAAADPDAAAWSDGVIVAKNTRLADFTAELDRYRAGKLRCDDEVADLRISGVYPLQDIDYVLDTLTHNFPIKVKTATRYWVTLTAADQ